jgi:hypothetical protein
MRIFQTVLIAGLFVPMGLGSGPAEPPPSVVERIDSSATAKVRQALRQSCDLTFSAMPLTEVVTILHSRYQIPVVIDTKGLDEAGIQVDVPLTLHVQGASLRTAFKNLLRPVEMTFVVGDELLITSVDRADQLMDARVYAVSELATVPGYSAPDYDTLVEVIVSTIKPSSWDDVGGPGAVAVLPSAGSLIVTQTDEVHEEIESLLANLRTARERMLADRSDNRRRSSWVEQSQTGYTGTRQHATSGVADFVVDVQRPKPRREGR